MRYLLDTDICVYIIKDRPLPVRERLAELHGTQAGMSVVSYLELWYGAWKSTQRQESLRKIEELREAIPVLPLDAEIARYFGRIRADLERQGTPIGSYDLMIAAHALSLDLILVTNNTREFARIEGLRLENWAA